MGDQIWGMLATIQFTFFIPVSHIKNTVIKIYRTIMLHVVLYGYETWSFNMLKCQPVGGLESFELCHFNPA
jgi:hypothetical protein